MDHRKFLVKLARYFRISEKVLNWLLDKKRRLDYLIGSLEKKFYNRPEIDPFRLHYVDPESITMAMEKEPSLSILDGFSPVKGGDWDKRVNNLGQYDIIYSFHERFNKGKEWEDTDFYLRAKRALNDNEVWGFRVEINSPGDLERYFRKIDTLHERIMRQGYRTQRDLFHENDDLFWVPSNMAFERHEVTVNIGRAGEIILDDGYHRLSISKVLDLDEIPVRIKIRHRKWLEIREKALSGEIVDSYQEHPDIKTLLKGR